MLSILRLYIERLWPFVLFLGACIYIYATPWTGHSMGDDFAMYMHHARNMAEGKPYHEVGFVLNPYYLTYSPKAYPPGFPLLLAPVFKYVGYDLMLFKGLVAAFFLGSFWFLYGLFRTQLRPMWLFIWALIWLSSPFHFHYRDNVLSDYPFLFWTAGALFFMSRQASPWQWGLSLVFIVMAWLTRSLGLFLLPAFLWQEYRRTGSYLTWSGGAMVLAFAGAWVGKAAIWPHDDGFMGMLIGSYQGIKLDAFLSQVSRHGAEYLMCFKEFWESGQRIAPLGRFTALSFLLFLGMGWHRQWRERIEPAQVFALLFTGLILVFPGYQGFRYFLPLMPWFLYWTIKGLQELESRFWAGVLGFCFLALSLGSAFDYFRQESYPQRYPYALGTKEFEEVFAAIKEYTGENDLILSTKPRFFSFYTGRPGLVYTNLYNVEQELALYRDKEVRFILTGPGGWQVNSIVEHLDSSQVELRFENAVSRLYEFKEKASENQ